MVSSHSPLLFKTSAWQYTLFSPQRIGRLINGAVLSLLQLKDIEKTWLQACGAQLENSTLSSWHTNPFQAQSKGRNHQHDVHFGTCSDLIQVKLGEAGNSSLFPLVCSKSYRPFPCAPLHLFLSSKNVPSSSRRAGLDRGCARDCLELGTLFLATPQPSSSSPCCTPAAPKPPKYSSCHAAQGAAEPSLPASY